MNMIIAAASASADALDDVISGAQSPSLVGLVIAGVPLMFVLIRWGLKYQKEFTNFYIEENIKLRDRLEKMENEMHLKDQELLAVQLEVGSFKNQLEYHQRTIEHLNNIIERRK